MMPPFALMRKETAAVLNPTPLATPDRRAFLKILGAGVLALAVPGGKLFASGAKPLRGIFPVAQTPFTESNKLDLEALVAELRFIDRGGVHGFVWPQMASEWTTLSEAERFAGNEAIAAAAKKLRPAIVIGVQGANLESAIKFAKHAEKVGADAIISLPPSENADPKTDLEYYKAVGAATQLPLFVQAIGNMNVDLLIEMYKAIPTFRYIKDELGNPLLSAAPLRARSGDQLKVFSGSHGRDLVDEMRRGFSGSMPAAPFADLYAQTWDLWHAGRHTEAMAMQARTLLILQEMLSHGPESLKYILHLRGVFPNYKVRTRQSPGYPTPKPGAAGDTMTLDDEGKQALRETLEFLKPYLKA